MNLLKFLAVLPATLSAVQGSMIKRANPQGIDVSSHQTSINWSNVKNNGISFAYIKATEGTCQ